MSLKKRGAQGGASLSALTPMDFHRFKHMTWRYKCSERMAEWSSPYWIVGVSPFDKHMFADEGHVVHLGRPRFVARWTMNETHFHLGNNQHHHFDDDLGLLIYEVSLLDEFTADLPQWLFEAACAVAYSRGLICAMDAIDDDDDADAESLSTSR